MRVFLTAFIIILFNAIVLNAQNITTIVGNGTKGNSGDGGSATNANLDESACIAFDTVGNLYLADSRNDRVLKVDFNTKLISTIAGDGTSGYSGDGGDAKFAQLNRPISIAFDKSGQLYIAELNNRVIRKIDKNGVIHTFAGTAIAGCDGDGGLALNAKFRSPYSICVDNNYNVYIADAGCSCVRKVNKDGIISSIAGNGINGYSGDGGPATAAKMGYPGFIAFDNKNNIIYIPDYVNKRVRKVNITSGIITTFAGNGTNGIGGDGGSATAASFIAANSVSLDSVGNVLICDNLGHNIRKVDTTGIITTIAGTGEEGFSADGSVATTAKFNRPNCAITDKWGNVYFCDVLNYRIRRINYNTTSLQEMDKMPINTTIFPNPAYENVIIKTDNMFIANIQIVDLNGCVKHSSVYTSQKREIKIDINNIHSGTYLIKVNGQYAGKVVKE